eukprot:11504935-Alexandrium_andersonii.AAC.1
MSASLVGSEMCIRDRAIAGGCQQVPVVEDRCRVVRPPWRGLGDCHGRAAVSYTHLTLPTICSV